MGYIPVSDLNAEWLGDRAISEEEALEKINEATNDDGSLRYGSALDSVKYAAAKAMAEANDIDPAAHMDTAKAAHEKSILSPEESAVEKPVVEPKVKETPSDDSVSTVISDNTSKVIDTVSTQFNKVKKDPWDSAGSLLTKAGDFIAAPFGDAKPGGVMSDTGNVLSSIFNWTGNAFSDLKNGRIEGGQGFLGFGLASLAAMVVAPWLGNKLGVLNLGGIGTLIIAALTIGYGGKFLKDSFVGQGSGRHRATGLPTTRVSTSSNTQSNKQDTNDTVEQKPMTPKEIAKTGDGSTLFVSDDDKDGKYEAKMMLVGQGTGKNIDSLKAMEFLSSVPSNNNADQIIKGAARNNNLISEENLGAFAPASKWEGEVIESGTSYGDVKILRPEGAANDANYIVLDIKDAG